LKSSIDKIAIVGGGSAGWLCAAYLAKHFQSKLPDAVQISLIESEDIGIIGVGEATVPSIRKTLMFLGIPEEDFMKATSATFKQAIRFDDWLHLPTQNSRSSFYHTFQKPITVNGESMAPYWVMSKEKHGKNYVDYATTQGQLCEAGLGPYMFEFRHKTSSLAYAYHLDASKFASLLKDLGKQYGVTHRLGTVTNVVTDSDGYIQHLEVKDQEIFEADLFIDCTGFAAHLIEKKLGSPFLDQSSVLFCNRAVTIQIPYEQANSPIRPFTTSTAQANGWIWDIGLDQRRGIGYVYSSQYTDDSDAQDALMDYVGPAGQNLSPRKLPMRVGYREKPWVKNCIAIGLSAGFIEPLESTGIHQVEISLNRIAKVFTRRGNFEYMSQQFNRNMTEWFELTFDFIKLHYCLSRRDDTDFWIDNRNPESIPDRLNHQIEIWRTRPTNRMDLRQMRPTFGESSYHQILFGLDFIPDLSGEDFIYPFMNLADYHSAQITNRVTRELQTLPNHRDLIKTIYASATSV
jgi:tryptophan halogenase